MHISNTSQYSRRIIRLALIFLVVEAVDEFADGLRRAAWPLIRNDLKIDYAHIGILLGLPSIIGGIIEPIIGVWGDIYNRKKIIIAGGVLFALSFLLISLSPDFSILLIAFIVFYPSSGAFVGLSQAMLMDTEPSRREHNMALWTLAGSIGVLLGPLALSLGGNHGMGWRQLFLMLAVFSGILVSILSRFTMAAHEREREKISFKTGMIDALKSLKKVVVVRWLILLKLSDLMLDTFAGFIALYFVDIVKVSPTTSSLAVLIATAAGITGNIVVIYLLKKMKGLVYVFWSAVLEIFLFSAFLLIPGFGFKVAFLIFIVMVNAGWYPVLKAQLYRAMHGKSGSVMTLGSLSNLIAGLFPLILGFIADRWGLLTTLWILLLAPVSIIIGVRKKMSIITPDRR